MNEWDGSRREEDIGEIGKHDPFESVSPLVTFDTDYEYCPPDL